jgi:hypothetical protein
MRAFFVIPTYYGVLAGHLPTGALLFPVLETIVGILTYIQLTRDAASVGSNKKSRVQ